MQRLLDFHIIGAARSGSTWLHSILRGTPGVYSPESEISIFEDPDYDANGLGRLADILAAAPAGDLVGIKRPNHLVRPECPARMARDVPGAKLLAILRDPVSRAVSSYYHEVRMGFLPPRSAEKGLSEILRTYQSGSLPSRVLADGIYGEAVARYLDHFPREQLLVIKNPANEAQRLQTYETVCRFLGLETQARPASLHRTVNEGPVSWREILFRRAANRIRFRYDKEWGRLHRRKIMNGPVGNWVDKLDLTQAILQKYLPAPPVSQPSAHLRARLREFYAGDIERLSRATGMDFSEWTPNPKMRA